MQTYVCNHSKMFLSQYAPKSKAHRRINLWQASPMGPDAAAVMYLTLLWGLAGLITVLSTAQREAHMQDTYAILTTSYGLDLKKWQI